MPEPVAQPSTRPFGLQDRKRSKPFQIVGFALRRGPLILLLGLVLLAGLLPLLLQKSSPIYETSARLILDPAKEPTLAGRERDAIPGNIGDYTRTLVSRLTSYEVLAEALGRLDGADFPAFLDPHHTVERNVFRLMSRVRVREVSRTYLISLTIGADQPRGLGPVLNQIMRVFVEKIQREQERQYERRLDYLTDERDKLLTRLEEDRVALLTLADSMDQKAFLHENYTLHISRQDMIQRLYWEAEAGRSEHKALLDKALADREGVRRLDLQPFADERVADNFGINRIEQWTYEQLQGLRASIDGLTPENPDRIYVEERMRAMNEFLGAYKRQVNEDTIRNLRETLEYELDLEVIKAQSAYQAARKNVEHLKALLDKAAAEASQTSEAIFNASELLFSIDQLRTRLTALSNRIDDAEMQAKAPVRLDIDKWAATPGKPSRSNAKTLALMALVLSFGTVGGFILVFDFLDDRLRDPGEMEKGMGGPGPAPVNAMHLAELPSGNMAEASLDNPRSPAVMAIRALAIRLDLEREKHGARVFVLAGLNPECGVTSLTLNLAHVLRAGHDRVLVIECNLARPGMARLASGLDASPGLWEVLSGANKGDQRHVVQREPQREVDVITVGVPGVTIPSRAALRAIIRASRKAYDIVLVDAASILEDDFSCFAAQHADAVLLVGREDISLFQDLRRSVDLLLEAEVPAVNAVLNFVRPKRGDQIRNAMQRQMQLVSRLHQGLHGRVRRGLRRLPGMR